MKRLSRILFPLLLLFGCAHSYAQLYPVSIDEKINASSLIVEAEVIKQQSFWNETHTFIYTQNTLKIYKLFKGVLPGSEVDVFTLGGTVGDYAVVVNDVLKLQEGTVGIFCLDLTKKAVINPLNKKRLYDVYSSSQGMFQHDLYSGKSFCPFNTYKTEALYDLIQKKTGRLYTIIDYSFSAKEQIQPAEAPGTAAVISSFSPLTVNGGAINDPSTNVLTINGTGFGATPSGKCGVKFKSGDSDDPDPTELAKYNSDYVISWSDTKIQVRVPASAATGNFAVILSDGTQVKSGTPLTVFYSVLDAVFTISGDQVVKEPRLMNTNGSGGYSLVYSTSTAGGGLDITKDPAQQTFQRALSTWKEVTGVNFAEAGNTTTQTVDAGDGDNVVMFDNNNTGIPPLANGVLALTYSGFSMCGNKTYAAQKSGFDVVIRNKGVSTGSILFTTGPCFPPVGEYDLEMILLHELGHALNLAHINDDYEKTSSSYSTINPSKLMHYAVLDYANRRSPDVSAYQGALYAVTEQGNIYGNCGLSAEEMNPLTITPAEFNSCPSTFPTSPLVDGTSIVIDLAHATSDKFVDPSFDQVNCQSSGTFVTNNAYYAFETNDNEVQNLQLNISGYTTVPADLSDCTGQGVRFALYDVSSCPQGQNFPAPIACNTFSTDGAVPPISGLQPNHKYLLYFDGLRNTKAIFNVAFNRSNSNGGENGVLISPNPVQDQLTIKFQSTASARYQYAMYDAAGKLIITNNLDVTPIAFTFNINMSGLASGVYFMRIINAQGDILAEKKILKVSQ